MNFINKLEIALSEAKIGNRSPIRIHVLAAQEQAVEATIIASAVETIVWSINNTAAVTATLRTMGHRFLDAIGVEDEDNARHIITLGGVVANLMAEMKLIKADKHTIIDKKGNSKDQYFFSVIDEELYEMVKEQELPALRADLGYQEWKHPVMHIGGRKLDIVKKARRYGLLDNYRQERMPDRYVTLNKLCKTEWSVNYRMLEVLAETPSNNNLIPTPISDEDKAIAMAQLGKHNRNALYIEELRFLELEKEGYDKKLAKQWAGKQGEDYKAKKNKEPLKIVSEWSKVQDFNKCLGYAVGYQDSVLNFIYNFCSRGRNYVANQSLLNPQGSDAAKSLLVFTNPKPINVEALKITIANHAGEDKVSYSDRIKWVDENLENIIEVGTDPWSTASMEWLLSSGISTEKKSKFQFIAAVVEYVEFLEWLVEGAEGEFLCKVPTARDGTNSGLQILSMIGRDEFIAPYVNITTTPKPGDVYQLIGNAVAIKAPVDKLFDALPVGVKAWRSIVKRNVMTKNYDATRWGMGQQQWEDKPNKDDDKTDVWHTLTFAECRLLGEVTYDTCNEYLVKASELMESMKKAISYNNNAVVSWLLPDGFLGFQAKPEMVRDNRQLTVKLGPKTVQLVLYTFLDTGNSRAHASAIAPDVVHSLDAWLLSTIINLLPEEANLAFVHDAFGADSCYWEEILSSAQRAYFEVTSRDVMKEVLKQVANGVEIELPEAGSYNPQEVFTAEYVVC